MDSTVSHCGCCFTVLLKNKYKENVVFNIFNCTAVIPHYYIMK